jgi:hypothetical protein
MASHFRGPLLGSRQAFGGAGENLGLDAVAGESDLVTTFDDFNRIIVAEGFGDAAEWETKGWTMVDAGAGVAGDAVSMNAIAGELHDSCLRINVGTTDDQGGNMQLDYATPPTDGGGSFPHIYIPINTSLADQTLVVFACRVGLIPEGTTWGGKVFIGFAEDGDYSSATGNPILTAAGGAIDVANLIGPIIGFHIPEDGSIDGVSQRTASDPMAEGTNFTDLTGTTWNTGLTAGSPVWFDLAFRMHITDVDQAADNGTTTFYWRQVSGSTPAPGLAANLAVGDGIGEWKKHSTVLENQTPNNGVRLVPTIEAMNGGAGDEIDLLVDWWAMGISRFSR